MINDILEYLEGKRVAILGFGLEGRSTYNFIRRHDRERPLTILDSKKLVLDDENVEIISGEHYLDGLAAYDLIIKTPGVSLKDVDASGLNITSQLELLLKFNSQNVIGITGTKGKSTTASLLHGVIKEQNANCCLVGNVGVPIFDEIENFDDETIIVSECSSHQLEFVDVSPHIGVILNLYQDHLDHAGSVKHYHDCKMHMFDYQKKDDVAIYCSDNENLRRLMGVRGYQQTVYDVSLGTESRVALRDGKVCFNGEVLYEDTTRRLKGRNNLENIMVVVLVAKLLGLDLKKAKETIDAFKGLENRLEEVGTYGGVQYYCDTIATIPEATIAGIEALGNVNTLIFGGMDRGIDYDDFVTYLEGCGVENLICMPTTGTKIGKQITQKKCYFVNTLEEAVEEAKAITKQGMVCLLSPAASSYEFFKNYIEKGNRFKELVRGD